MFNDAAVYTLGVGLLGVKIDRLHLLDGRGDLEADVKSGA
jgi:hypothetical protein